MDVREYRNDTWLMDTTDSFGRATFPLHSDLPMTVLVAAPGHRGAVARGWRPTSGLTVQLEPFPAGGSVVLTEGSGHLPGLRGRLNPILDALDRMCFYVTNVGIDGGRPQPVHFRLGQELGLTDAYGSRLMVRFVEMVGRSALLDYWPAG